MVLVSTVCAYLFIILVTTRNKSKTGKFVNLVKMRSIRNDSSEKGVKDAQQNQKRLFFSKENNDFMNHQVWEGT